MCRNHENFVMMSHRSIRAAKSCKRYTSGNFYVERTALPETLSTRRHDAKACRISVLLSEGRGLGTVTAMAQGMHWNNVLMRLSLTTGRTICALGVLPMPIVLATLMSAAVTRLWERCR
jgi:hypothetical protein